MTTISPRNTGSEPSTRPPATIRPHAAIGTGFSATARIDVLIAVPSATSRSISSGNDTTLIASTSTANRKPTPMPTTIIDQPAGVVSTSRTNVSIEAGGVGPSVAA